MEAHLWTSLRMHLSQRRQKTDLFLSETWSASVTQGQYSFRRTCFDLIFCNICLGFFVLLIIFHLTLVVKALPPCLFRKKRLWCTQTHNARGWCGLQHAKPDRPHTILYVSACYFVVLPEAAKIQENACIQELFSHLCWLFRIRVVYEQFPGKG